MITATNTDGAAAASVDPDVKNVIHEAICSLLVALVATLDLAAESSS